MAQDRIEDARLVLAKQHANGDLHDPLVSFELQEIEHAISLERSSASTNYSSFFKTRANRKRIFIVATIAFGGQWNGVGIIFYYIVPVLRSINITSPTKQTIVQGGITIASYAFALTGASCVEKLGRRPVWIASTSLMLGSLIVVTALSATFARGRVLRSLPALTDLLCSPERRVGWRHRGFPVSHSRWLHLRLDSPQFCLQRRDPSIQPAHEGYGHLVPRQRPRTMFWHLDKLGGSGGHSVEVVHILHCHRHLFPPRHHLYVP